MPGNLGLLYISTQHAPATTARAARWATVDMGCSACCGHLNDRHRGRRVKTQQKGSGKHRQGQDIAPILPESLQEDGSMLRDFGLVAGGALLAMAGRWLWDEWSWRRTMGLGSELVWAVIRRQEDRDAEYHRFDSDAPPAEDPWDLVIYKEDEPFS